MPVLGEDRPQLPGLSRGEDAEEQRRAVERRDRDQVEDRQRDVELHEQRKIAWSTRTGRLDVGRDDDPDARSRRARP